jgi:hypothetical protein
VIVDIIGLRLQRLKNAIAMDLYETFKLSISCYVEERAVYYAPKEELVSIKAIVAEVIFAIENKKNTWERIIAGFAGF